MDFRFQENSWQFCSTITFFQILFIVLFGLFVKYDDDFYKNIENEKDPIAKSQLIAVQVRLNKSAFLLIERLANQNADFNISRMPN